MRVVIRITDVEVGKNKNYLVFKGFVPSLNNNKKFEFSYCGTEISTNASISEDGLRNLKELFNEAFGYPGELKFNCNYARNVIKNMEVYEIEM